jgi:hypothetical protein
MNTRKEGANTKAMDGGALPACFGANPDTASGLSRKGRKRIMKKIMALTLALALMAGVAFAGGDQNQGSTGTGTTSTGSSAQGSADQPRSGR